MNLIPRPPAVTFEQFCDRVRDGEKADLIDGVIYMASPDNLDANELFVWLISLLDMYVREADVGKVFGSRAAFRIAHTQAPEPDVAFVRKGRLHLRRRGYFDGPPDLALEIVSPDSIDRDYRKKREQYRRARVPEYWIVDEVAKQVTLLRLTPTGGYREVRPRQGVLHSRVLPGFWLRTAWLWQDQLPMQTKVLAEIRGR
jgi:Uma2 family endonuclease